MSAELIELKPVLTEDDQKKKDWQDAHMHCPVKDGDHLWHWITKTTGSNAEHITMFMCMHCFLHMEVQDMWKYRPTL